MQVGQLVSFTSAAMALSVQGPWTWRPGTLVTYMPASRPLGCTNHSLSSWLLSKFESQSLIMSLEAHDLDSQNPDFTCQGLPKLHPA